ncbi:MAG: hypothetical protein HYR91_13440 [Flavobacteriia bacterium]|nr:hypothetical protein [Flavobacteriia bacterium]
MKKIYLTVLTVALSLTSLNSNAQCIEQGKILIDGYYGFPNLYSSIFKGLYANSGTELNLKIGSLGPIGLRTEYLLTDKIGLGLDLGFNSSSISYDDNTTIYNSTTGNYDPITYNYKFSTKKIGAIATFNFHFIENDNLDAYFTVGMGYGNRSFTYASNDPNYSFATVKSIIPVAYKIGVGMRYFFTENIGANLALGFGQGGLINAGLTAKF